MLLARTEVSGESSSLMSKKALALVMKSGEEKFSRPWTTRCVGRMVMPGASMLTKVIIMAASGKAGRGGGCGELFVLVAGLVEGELELGGALLGVGDGGLVAVVAIGDDELLVGHGGDDEVDESGVGELPDLVDDAVLVGDGEVGGVVVEAVGAISAEDELFGGEGGVGVEHVDLLAVGAGGLEEAHAVGLVLGEGLLVAVDDLVGVVVEVAEGDEAAALADFVWCGGRCRSGSSRRGRARILRRGCARGARCWRVSAARV